MRLFRGTGDVCEKMKTLKDDEKPFLAMLGVPDHCPIKKVYIKHSRRQTL
jgi:hypothetical protein